MRVLFVEVDGVRKAIRVVQRIRQVFFGVLVFLYRLYDSSQFKHDLLHPLQQFVVVLVGFVREQFQDRVLRIGAGMDHRDINVLGQESVLHLPQLQL